MGIKINEEQAIEILSDIRMNVNYKCNTETQTGMACKLAIDIMRKYQKIQEIYDNWNVDFGVETHRAMSKIGEVLEDDND